jgi:hypothetical protein
MASKAKIEELKKISRDRYEEDGGTTTNAAATRTSPG